MKGGLKEGRGMLAFLQTVEGGEQLGDIREDKRTFGKENVFTRPNGLRENA